MSEGKKFDSAKPKMYLLPPKAIVEVSKVLTFGAEKYDEENWRKLDNLQNRYTGGALRHLFAHHSVCNDKHRWSNKSRLEIIKLLAHSS